MQVYFIDNEDYFKRVATLTDGEWILFPDNDERAIFFAKGVIETVKKLNWSPDVIHVHGWLASMLPLYLRNYYANEPLFNDSKIVTSVYDHGYKGSLDKNMLEKVKFDGIDEAKITALSDPTYDNVMKVAIDNSDAIIIGSEEVPEELSAHLKTISQPVLEYKRPDEFAVAYEAFYESEVLV